MSKLRIHIAGRLVALFAGLVFLNASFVLVEMNAIDLKVKNLFLYECMSKAVTGAGFEEENDGQGKTSKISGLEEFTTYKCAHLTTAYRFFIINELYYTISNQTYLSFDLEITTPPPKT